MRNVPLFSRSAEQEVGYATDRECRERAPPSVDLLEHTVQAVNRSGHQDNEQELSFAGGILDGVEYAVVVVSE